MHRTNITLPNEDGELTKYAFRERVTIPFDLYQSITGGDDAAGRPRRLERID